MFKKIYKKNWKEKNYHMQHIDMWLVYILLKAEA